jgi:hypothetical protein
MHDEAATLPTAWQGESGAHVSIMGHLGTTHSVLVQWELMSALTVLVLFPIAMHVEAATPPAAWQGERGPCLLSWAIWAQHSVCVVQWELMSALTFLTAT